MPVGMVYDKIVSPPHLGSVLGVSGVLYLQRVDRDGQVPEGERGSRAPGSLCGWL